MADMGASEVASLALGGASTGMSILGGVNQSEAQRAAGQAAYQTALNRAMLAKVEADQLDQNAGQAEAASQRQGILAQRRGLLAASRLRAVMAASGGGVDDNMLAAVAGTGNYNRDVALYEGADKARQLRNQARLQRWSGQAGLQQGEFDRSQANSAADSTLFGTIGKGVLSFADKYGGGLFKDSASSNIDDEIGQWSKYGQDDLSRASLDAAMQRAGGYVV